MRSLFAFVFNPDQWSKDALIVKKLVFISILTTLHVLAQPRIPSSDYKYVLRIQRGIESEVGFYLDEPRTGDLKKVHRESTEYLLLSEAKADSEVLTLRSERIKKAVEQLVVKNYEPNFKPLKKKNIRYHYIYIDEFSND